MNQFEYTQSNNLDVVISSRVRLARNLKGYPFPFKLTQWQADEIINKVKSSLLNNDRKINKELLFLNLQELDSIDRQILVEKHLISPELAVNNTYSGLILSNDEKISIMINEEDHLRIQCIYPGMQIEEAWELCSDVDSSLECNNEFAFNSKYGYLTACPTNLGTGIRISSMLHLPATTMTGYLRGIVDICMKLGLTVRGIYGEHSEATGSIFQISNQRTLGECEESILTNVKNIILQIIEQERKLRLELYKKDKLLFEDKVFRSYGTLTSARIISTEEALKLLSDVRLGVYMGIIKNIDIKLVDNIMLIINPGYIQKFFNRPLTPEERDIQRATLIRQKLIV